MAKDNRKRQADEFDDFDKGGGPLPKDFTPTAPVALGADPTDAAAMAAEIERLKAESAAARKDAEYAYRRADQMAAELSALKAASPVSAGGKFTVSIKDGPTATVEVPAGERPEDVFNATLGIHSTPHRHSVLAAGEDAKCGVHYPDGSVRAFGAAV